MAETGRTRMVMLAFGLGVLALVGVAAVINIRKANRAANDSAHAALMAEIEHLLAAVSLGQRYPDSLSQLPLTFPDGGTTSLLSRFTYTSTGTNCSFRTVFRGEERVRTFP